MTYFQRLSRDTIGLGRGQRAVALLALLFLPACTSELHCPVSIDTYCGSTSAPECTYRDYQEALWQWNQEAEAATMPSSTVWGCAQSDDYDMLLVNKNAENLTVERYFKRATEQLVAILRNAGNGRGDICVAGPPLFAPPTFDGEDGRCGYGTPPDGAVTGTPPDGAVTGP